MILVSLTRKENRQLRPHIQRGDPETVGTCLFVEIIGNLMRKFGSSLFCVGKSSDQETHIYEVIPEDLCS